MMHQSIRPHVRIPIRSTVIHVLTQRSWIIPVWLVVSRSTFGSQPRWTSAEHPVNNNAPEPAIAKTLATPFRRLLVRSCELTDGPSSLLVLNESSTPSGRTQVNQR